MAIKSIEVDDLASIGAIADEPGYQLPPEAWTLTNNVRCLDGGMRRLYGWSQIFAGSPDNIQLHNAVNYLLQRDGTSKLNLHAGSGGGMVDTKQGPYFLLFVSSSAQPWWLWASLTDIWVWDGSTHTKISKSPGVYTATAAANWNGTILGGIPIINDGSDPPQFWNSYSKATLMADLSNFPASTSCRVIRAFGPFLVALNITASGVNTPHRVLWSTEAAPGSLPGSWNIADPTVDAGENDLPDTDSGIIQDGLVLQGNFYIYKEASVWRMSYIGGRFLFQFQSFLDTAGCLTTRCVAATGDGQKHVFVTQDDMLMHDGNTATPLLERKFKRYLFNQIDTTNYQNCFMFSNPTYDEIWFCYPQSGSTLANRALIFNYKHGKFTEADIDFQCATVGVVSTSSTQTWANSPYTWATDPNAWLVSTRRRTVIGNPTTQKMHLFDNGVLRDGVAYTGTLQRTGLGIIGRKRTGEWLEDFQTRKQINRVWPKCLVGPVNVRIGYQDLVNGAIRWSNPQAFDPTTAMWVDGVLGSGRAVAIEYAAPNDFRIDGYKLDMALLGKF